MSFLPKTDVLTLEELDRLCSAFVARGVRKLRLTGGEPLVRRGIMSLINSLSRHLRSGALDELTLTTNGSQLEKYSRDLAAAGIQRINVSLDTLDAGKFRAITRWGALDRVLAGIDAAQAAGLKIKINVVALKNVNDDEFPRLIEWAHGRGMDLTLIEVMPLGEIGEDRIGQYLPLSTVRAQLLIAINSTPLTIERVVQRAMCALRKPAVASASSRRLRTISANPAIACVSLARARFTCASARRTPPTCADRCEPRKPTFFSMLPSMKRSAGSPRAMTSSSIAAISVRRSPAI